jgi:predicted hydrocarbon binding protein
MRRKEFLRCCTGVCSCGALGWLASQSMGAEAVAPASQATHPAPTPTPDPELESLRWKLGAVQTRFARLIGILDHNVDEPVRRKILQELGAECARSFASVYEPYRGRLREFLAQVETQWVEKAEYDEAAGVIRIIDRSRECTCPFVKMGETPGDFCDCSLGWQKLAYSTILGRPVEVEVEESLLRGGKRCVLRISVA